MCDKKVSYSLVILAILHYLLYYTESYINYMVFGMLLLTLTYVTIKLKKLFPYAINYLMVVLIMLILIIITIIFFLLQFYIFNEFNFQNNRSISNIILNSTEIKKWLILSVSWITAAVNEELFFRFLFYSNKRRNQIINGIISSVLFSLFHNVNNYIEFFYYFSVGYIFYICYVKNRNIWYAILPHAIFNFIGMPVAYIYNEVLKCLL